MRDVGQSSRIKNCMSDASSFFPTESECLVVVVVVVIVLAALWLQMFSFVDSTVPTLPFFITRSSSLLSSMPRVISATFVPIGDGTNETDDDDFFWGMVGLS